MFEYLAVNQSSDNIKTDFLEDKIQEIGCVGGSGKEINCTGFDCEPISPDFNRLMPNNPLATVSRIEPNFRMELVTNHDEQQKEDGMIYDEDGRYLDSYDEGDTIGTLSSRYMSLNALRIRPTLLPQQNVGSCWW